MSLSFLYPLLFICGGTQSGDHCLLDMLGGFHSLAHVNV